MSQPSSLSSRFPGNRPARNGPASRLANRFLDPGQLLEFTRFHAREFAVGKYPFIDFDEQVRWHKRIYRDPRTDVWLISWLPTQGTQLHDHGGSSGAFTVLSGSLTEAVVSGARGIGVEPSARPGQARMTDSQRDTGESVAFGPHYIHDVRNLGDASAVSVHAYSPPLTTMNFYDIDDGALVPLMSLATDDPEPVLDISTAS